MMLNFLWHRHSCLCRILNIAQVLNFQFLAILALMAIAQAHFNSRWIFVRQAILGTVPLADLDRGCRPFGF